MQSLVKCLDHRDIASDTVKQGCDRLRDAVKCTQEAILTVMERRITDQKAADTTIMAFVADCWGEAESWPQAQAQRMQS